MIHCAASLNRKSEKSCLNVNLRGTLEVIQLAMRARDEHGLRRFSHVSTVAVAGQRAMKWCRKILPSTGTAPTTILTRAPKNSASTWCGNCCPMFRARFFVRASCSATAAAPKRINSIWFARSFFSPDFRRCLFGPTDRIDIVPVDYVADSVVTLHQKQNPDHEIYHLSSGAGSETFVQLTDALAKAQGKRGPMFVPSLEGPSSKMVNALAGRARENRRPRDASESFSALSRVEHGV